MRLYKMGIFLQSRVLEDLGLEGESNKIPSQAIIDLDEVEHFFHDPDGGVSIVMKTGCVIYTEDFGTNIDEFAALLQPHVIVE